MPKLIEPERKYNTEDANRLATVMLSLGYEGKFKKFATVLGYANHGSIYNVLYSTKEKPVRISEAMALKICNMFPQINYSYLRGSKDAPVFKEGFERTAQQHILAEPHNKQISELGTDLAIRQILAKIELLQVDLAIIKNKLGV